MTIARRAGRIDGQIPDEPAGTSALGSKIPIQLVVLS